MRSLKGRVAALAAVVGLVAGCDDGTGVQDFGRVEVRFQSGAGGGGDAADAARAVPVEGINGTLTLESVHLIVGELELEGADDACEEVDGAPEADDDCEEFEAAPFLLDLPLDGGVVTVAVADVRPGVYTSFEFEVEDLDADDIDDDDGGELAAVLSEARALHPDWPDEGSMVVEGTFTPVGEAEGRPFRTFIEAEVEVEAGFSPPLVVEADGEAALTVVLDPALWFTGADGKVLDLSLYHFDGEGDDLLELEVELEKGVMRVEVDDD